MRRAIAGPVAIWLLLGAALVFPTSVRAGIHVSLEPDSAVVQPGDTVTVKLNVFQAESQFNAFAAYVIFDPGRLAFVSVSPDSQIGTVLSGVCNNFFHQFVANADHVDIQLSMLCSSTFVTGPGEIYRLRFRVLAGTGPTNLVWRSDTEFFRAGFFVRPVEMIPMTLFVGGVSAVQPRSVGVTGLSLETPRPNPYRGNGPVTLDFSLASPARIGFSILDAQGRRVVSRAPEDFGAGTHSVVWTGLRLGPGRYLAKMTSGANGETARTWVVVR